MLSYGLSWTKLHLHLSVSVQWSHWLCVGLHSPYSHFPYRPMYLKSNYYLANLIGMHMKQEIIALSIAHHTNALSKAMKVYGDKDFTVLIEFFCWRRQMLSIPFDWPSPQSFHEYMGVCLRYSHSCDGTTHQTKAVAQTSMKLCSNSIFYAKSSDKSFR